MDGVLGLITNGLFGVYAALYGLVANILSMLTGIFLAVAVELLKFVLSPGFISLSYTNAGLSPSDANFNEFLSIGWNLTRSLTNIIFVIALVAIGLGTALRLAGYEAKKALPTLILIALLINFTPVMLGLIVDASNIVMNFFIQGGFAGGNNFVSIATSQWSNVGSLAGGLTGFWNPLASEKAKAAAAGSIVLIFFNLIAALIYILFAFIFILRYVAIWLLVILSPIAFASYILPATRGIWSQWWKQFIQWSIIGIIAGFFLYLGDWMIRTTTSQNFLSGEMAEIPNATGLAPIINNVLPYIISIIFLFIGLILSMTGAPMGAKGIMQAGQRGIDKAGKISARWSWEGAKALHNAPFRAARATMERYQMLRSAKLPGRTEALSRGEALRAAVGYSFRKTPMRRALKELKKEIPTPIRTYGEARALGSPRKDAFVAAASRWREWAPAGSKTQAAQQGLKNAAKEVWGAARGKVKKKKPKGTKKCLSCGRYVDIDDSYCSFCGGTSF